MCFSATANFAGSAVLGTIGAVTLTEVKHRRELLFASLPLLFATHQFIEGFVWLGLDGKLPSTVTYHAGEAYVVFAQGLLPLLMPLGVMLMEPTEAARRRMLPFVFLGVALSLYMLWGLAVFPLQVYALDNSVVYKNQATNRTSLAVLYVIATCGSLFFSKIRGLILFGAANLGILLVVMAVKRYAFTSLWCAYAAVASIIIWVYFRNNRHARASFYSRLLETSAFG